MVTDDSADHITVGSKWVSPRFQETTSPAANLGQVFPRRFILERAQPLLEAFCVHCAPNLVISFVSQATTPLGVATPMRSNPRLGIGS